MKIIIATIAVTALSVTSAMACGMNKTASKHDTMTTASISTPMTTAEQLPSDQVLEPAAETSTEESED